MKRIICICLVLMLSAVFALGSMAAEYPVTLTDQAGREVTLENIPERIVSGYYISTSACIALGLLDRMAAIETGAQKRNIYALAAPELMELPNTGSAKAFDLEACIAAEPDLVILPKKLSEQAEIMADMGISVLLVYPEDQALMEEMIGLIASAAGVEDRAQDLINEYALLRAEAEALVQYADRPTALMMGNSSYLTCAPGDMYQSGVISAAGGVNAAEQLSGGTWTEISYEQLLEMDPDYLLIPSEAAYTGEDILKDKQLQNMDAVKNGRVFAMPDEYEAWDSPDVSGILGVLWTMNVLHGDLYPAEALKMQVKGFYEEFFGFTPDMTWMEQ